MSKKIFFNSHSKKEIVNFNNRNTIKNKHKNKNKKYRENDDSYRGYTFDDTDNNTEKKDSGRIKVTFSKKKVERKKIEEDNVKNEVVYVEEVVPVEERGLTRKITLEEIQVEQEGKEEIQPKGLQGIIKERGLHGVEELQQILRAKEEKGEVELQEIQEEKKEQEEVEPQIIQGEKGEPGEVGPQGMQGEKGEPEK